MKGQISIYDVFEIGEPLRPCDYRFTRYLGQKVKFFTPDGGKPNGEEAKIIMICGYYTYCKTTGGKVFVGTPTTIYPINPEERRQSNENEQSRKKSF